MPVRSPNEAQYAPIAEALSHEPDLQEYVTCTPAIISSCLLLSSRLTDQLRTLQCSLPASQRCSCMHNVLNGAFVVVKAPPAGAAQLLRSTSSTAPTAEGEGEPQLQLCQVAALLLPAAGDAVEQAQLCLDNGCTVWLHQLVDLPPAHPQMQALVDTWSIAQLAAGQSEVTRYDLVHVLCRLSALNYLCSMYQPLQYLLSGLPAEEQCSLLQEHNCCLQEAVRRATEPGPVKMTLSVMKRVLARSAAGNQLAAAPAAGLPAQPMQPPPLLPPPLLQQQEEEDEEEEGHAAHGAAGHSVEWDQQEQQQPAPSPSGYSADWNHQQQEQQQPAPSHSGYNANWNHQQQEQQQPAPSPAGYIVNWDHQQQEQDIDVDADMDWDPAAAGASELPHVAAAHAAAAAAAAAAAQDVQEVAAADGHGQGDPDVPEWLQGLYAEGLLLPDEPGSDAALQGGEGTAGPPDDADDVPPVPEMWWGPSRPGKPERLQLPQEGAAVAAAAGPGKGKGATAGTPCTPAAAISLAGARLPSATVPPPTPMQAAASGAAGGAGAAPASGDRASRQRPAAGRPGVGSAQQPRSQQQSAAAARREGSSSSSEDQSATLMQGSGAAAHLAGSQQLQGQQLQKTHSAVPPPAKTAASAQQQHGAPSAAPPGTGRRPSAGCSSSQGREKTERLIQSRLLQREQAAHSGKAGETGSQEGGKEQRGSRRRSPARPSTRGRSRSRSRDRRSHKPSANDGKRRDSRLMSRSRSPRRSSGAHARASKRSRSRSRGRGRARRYSSSPQARRVVSPRSGGGRRDAECRRSDAGHSPAWRGARKRSRSPVLGPPVRAERRRVPSRSRSPGGTGWQPRRPHPLAGRGRLQVDRYRPGDDGTPTAAAAADMLPLQATHNGMQDMQQQQQQQQQMMPTMQPFDCGDHGSMLAQPYSPGTQQFYAGLLDASYQQQPGGIWPSNASYQQQQGGIWSSNPGTQGGWLTAFAPAGVGPGSMFPAESPPPPPTSNHYRQPAAGPAAAEGTGEGPLPLLGTSMAQGPLYADDASGAGAFPQPHYTAAAGLDRSWPGGMQAAASGAALRQVGSTGGASSGGYAKPAWLRVAADDAQEQLPLYQQQQQQQQQQIPASQPQVTAAAGYSWPMPQQQQLHPHPHPQQQQQQQLHQHPQQQQRPRSVFDGRLQLPADAAAHAGGMQQQGSLRPMGRLSDADGQSGRGEQLEQPGSGPMGRGGPLASEEPEMPDWLELGVDKYVAAVEDLIRAQGAGNSIKLVCIHDLLPIPQAWVNKASGVARFFAQFEQFRVIGRQVQLVDVPGHSRSSRGAGSGGGKPQPHAAVNGSPRSSRPAAWEHYTEADWLAAGPAAYVDAVAQFIRQLGQGNKVKVGRLHDRLPVPEKFLDDARGVYQFFKRFPQVLKVDKDTKTLELVEAAPAAAIPLPSPRPQRHGQVAASRPAAGEDREDDHRMTTPLPRPPSRDEGTARRPSAPSPAAGGYRSPAVGGGPGLPTGKALHFMIMTLCADIKSFMDSHATDKLDLHRDVWPMVPPQLQRLIHPDGPITLEKFADDYLLSFELVSMEPRCGGPPITGLQQRFGPWKQSVDCKYWEPLKLGGCRRGDRCEFKHGLKQPLQ